MKTKNQPTKTKYEDVTAADVKACKGYEDISEELAQKLPMPSGFIPRSFTTALRRKGLKSRRPKSYQLVKEKRKKQPNSK